MTDTPELLVADVAQWREWLADNHEASTGVRLVLAKNGATEPTRLTYDEALPEALERAKNDGRWARAYDGSASIAVPNDLAEALAASPRAQAMWDVLTRTNRYAVLYRIQEAKREETRARRISQYVEMLARGDTPHPQKAKPAGTRPPWEAGAVIVRPLFANDDVAWLNEGNPLGWLATFWLDLERGGDLEASWFVVEVEGVARGFGAACPMAVAMLGYGAGIVSVRPEARRRGAGNMLVTAVEDACRGRVPGLQISYDESVAVVAAPAAAAWGYVECARHRESALDLTSLDRDRFAELARVDGIDLASLPAEATDEEWRAAHAFMLSRVVEAPDMEGGGGEMPYGAWRGAVQDPHRVLLAREADEIVGVTAVMGRQDDPRALNTMFTGVAPRMRGRGIARALKAQHALQLAAAGATRIVTQNMVDNEPILAANRRLGFTEIGGYVDVHKALGADDVTAAVTRAPTRKAM
jgi:GNAT superfamily N-acetyltransferase